jgi:anti-sigma28 factor (negative regulator of flagellin synthesis)
MKVYDVNLTGPSASESGRAQETQKADRGSSSSAAASPTSSDRVELSGTLARIARAVSSYSADRSDKVAALTEQFQSGNFHPDSVQTSQGMIADALSAGTA